MDDATGDEVDVTARAKVEEAVAGSERSGTATWRVKAALHSWASAKRQLRAMLVLGERGVP